MNRHLTNKTKKLLLLGIMLVMGIYQLGAQALSGAYSIPGSYSSIEAAVAALNTNGVSGAVTFNIGAGAAYSETPATTIVLGSATLNATTSITNTITFQRAATATANPVIIAYAGTKLSTSTDSIDGIFAIAGTDFVTINGIDLLDPVANTTPTTCMEYGYGLYKLNVNDGANNNTIQNCVITLNRVNATGPGAGARANIAGSTGIDMVNSNRQLANTALVQTVISGASSNNKFYANTIQNCNFGIALAGSSAAAPYTLADVNNDIGGSSYTTGNTILNFGGGVGATVQCGATYISNQYSANISYNNINNNNGNGVNHPATNRGIWLFGNSPGASINVNFNIISIKSGAATTPINWVIDMEMAQSGANGNTININNNQLINCTSAIGSTVAFTGIWVNSAPTTLNINNNYFYGFTYHGTAASQAACILNQLAGVGTLNINNNTIDSTILTGATGAFYNIVSTASTVNRTNINDNTITRTSLINAGTGTKTMYPIFNSGASPIVNAIGNTISDITRNGTTGGTTIGIYLSSGTNQNVIRNTISNFTITGTGAASAMYGIQMTGTTIVCDSNTVFNLNVAKTTGTGIMYGIFDGSVPSNENYRYNTIYNLTHAGTGTIDGLYAFSTTGVRTVSYNTIYNLLGNSTVNGMRNASSVPRIFNNKIYDIRTNSTTTGVASGIVISTTTAGAVQIYNNLVSRIFAPLSNNTTPSVFGLNLTFTTAITTLGIYHNTILLDSTSGGANFSSACILTHANAIATTVTLDLRNNILVNNAIPKGTGNSVVLRRSAAALNNYANTSNRNLFFAGTPSAFNLIYFDGIAGDSLLADFKFRLGTFEQASVTQNPTFLSLVGSDPNFLHLDPMVPTVCESGAANVAPVTFDFANVIRQGNIGYTGTGSAPDIGADEGEFLGIPMVLDTSNVDQNTAAVPINSSNQMVVGIRVHTQNNFSPLILSAIKLNTAGTTNVADIQNARVYYTGNSPVFATTNQFGSTVATPNGVYYANGSRTLLAGANYFWVTYDTRSTATANNFIDVWVDSLVISGINTAPINGNPTGSRRILAPLNGTYNVGVGQTYPTITSAAADLSALGVSGPVTFLLKDVLYNAASGEVFPIVMNAYVGSSTTNTITIRPDVGIFATVENTSAAPTFDLNGINNLIIDGRPGGTGVFVTGNSLIIANTNAAGMALRLNNEASFNRILYCDLRSNNITAPGTINAGVVSFGASAGLNGNDNNTIKFCHIHEVTGGNPTIAVSSIGSASSIAANNDNNLVDSCNIYNFFSPTLATAGIYIGANNSAWTINANRFYQTATVTTTGTPTHRVMWVTPNVAALTSASGFNITNNFIGGNASNGTGVYTMAGTSGYQFFGMDISVGLGTTTLVQNNTITNFNYTSGFAGNGTYGINIANGNVNIFNNLFGSTTTNGAFTFTTTVANGSLIALRSGAGGNLNFSNNIVSGVDLISNNSTLFAGFNGIAASGGANIIINNNTVGSTTLLNSINGVSTSATATGASAFRGIICNSGTAGANNTVTNNTVANINLNYSAAGVQATTLVGIAVTTGTSTVSGNIIRNLTSATQTTTGVPNAAVAGIAYSSITAPVTITGNTISSLVLTGPSTTAAVQAVGISFSGPSTGTNTISRNSVHSLSINATNPAAFITGFDVSGGIANVQNNMIRLGYDSLGADIISSTTFRGISKFAGSFNFYFNSVFIGGNGVAAGASNTFAFARNSAGTEIVRNNIFVNNRSNAAGTGKHYQVFLANTTTLTLNNNIYFGNGTGSVFGTLNNGVTDVTAYSSGWVAADNASGVANPQFINATGNASNGDLHISATLATPIESSGAAIAVVTDDFDGQTRTTLTPTDIGADAGNFVPLDIFPPTITPFTLSNFSSTGDRTFTVNITDVTGIPTIAGSEPRVYFRKFASGSWNSTAAVRTSGTAQNGQWSFTIPQATLGGLILGDSVYAYIIAQDSSAALNIASFPGGAVATSVNIVSTPPATLLSYRIVPGLSGVVNVGVGQTYTSLTGAGGLFETVNNSSLNGNLTAVITSDLLEDGTNGINQINETGAGNYTFTIAPDGTTERLIVGNVQGAGDIGGLIRINGADRVKIDGSFGGSGRFLRFRNRAFNTTFIPNATIRFQNDAKLDTVRNCFIEGTDQAVGTILFSTTNLAGGFGNDSNAVINCVIRDTLGNPAAGQIPNTALQSQGTAGIGNDYNTFANNEVFNHGFALANLGINAGDFWNFSNNSFYLTTVKANPIIAYQVDGGTGHIFNGNSMGGSAPNRSGAALTTTNATNPNITAIRINNAVTTAQITNNTFSNIASTSAVNLINILAGNVTITNNTIGGGAMPYDTVQNGFDNGIINVSGGTVSIVNNTIGNISYYDAAGDRTSGITVSNGTATITGNTIRDIKGNSSGTLFTFLITGMHISGGTNHVIEQNTVSNIFNINTGAAAYTAVGINVTGGTNTTVSRNRIHTIYGNGTGTGAGSNQVFGMYVSSIGGVNVRNNQISMGNNTIGETRVYGIQDVAGSGTNTYYNNSIFVNGNTTGGSNNSYCLHRTGLGNIMSFNNIFVNKRSTNGTGFNYATGSNSLTGITPNSTNYNLHIVNDTLRVNEGPLNFGNSLSVFNSLYTNANTYSANWYALNNAVPAQTLFTDTLTGNLGIVTSNPNSWYAHGKGLALAAVSNDFNNATRATSIANGATDLGSVEFTTTTTPPSAIASAAPALNTTTNYTFAGRNIASITWGAIGTVPSAVNVVYYSGINAPNLIASRTQYNAYTAITPTGGAGYAYGITLIADSATFGNVASSNESRIARYAGTNWNLISNSFANGFTGSLQTATNTQSAFGNFTGTSNSNPLPVNLLSFTATALEDDVLVSWQTASETNNKGFEVERSVDGNSFEQIAFVKGANNSTRIKNYATSDYKAFEIAQSTRLYYRLKQLDNDGSFTYSSVVLVNRDNMETNDFIVFPNPFVNEFTISLHANQNEVSSIDLLDLQGKLVSKQMIALNQGLNKLPITNLSQVQAGIYFLRVSHNGTFQIKKIVKN
jgi:hypothetical protein